MSVVNKDSDYMFIFKNAIALNKQTGHLACLKTNTPWTRIDLLKSTDDVKVVVYDAHASSKNEYIAVTYGMSYKNTETKCVYIYDIPLNKIVSIVQNVERVSGFFGKDKYLLFADTNKNMYYADIRTGIYDKSAVLNVKNLEFGDKVVDSLYFISPENDNIIDFVDYNIRYHVVVRVNSMSSWDVIAKIKGVCYPYLLLTDGTFVISKDSKKNCECIVKDSDVIKCIRFISSEFDIFKRGSMNFLACKKPSNDDDVFKVYSYDNNTSSLIVSKTFKSSNDAIGIYSLEDGAIVLKTGGGYEYVPYIENDVSANDIPVNVVDTLQKGEKYTLEWTTDGAFVINKANDTDAFRITFKLKDKKMTKSGKLTFVA